MERGGSEPGEALVESSAAERELAALQDRLDAAEEQLAEARRARMEHYAHLMKAGASVAPESGDLGASSPPLRVLHVLALSLPHVNGYSIRSKNILAVQRASTWADPLVATSPFYPGNASAIEDAEIAGVHHFRVPHPVDVPHGELTFGDRLAESLYRSRHSRPLRRLRSWRGVQRLRSRVARLGDTVSRETGGRKGGRKPGSLRRVERRLGALAARVLGPALTVAAGGVLPAGLRSLLESFEERLLMARFERGLVRIARREGVDIVHAHSPFRSALPAIRVARKLGLAVVYEVRGIWEESAVASGSFARGDAAYRRWRRRETAAMRGADAVIAIGEELRREIVSRGVPAERVFIAPNAVDPEEFSHGGRGERRGDRPLPLASRLAAVTVGYVGSVRPMEGVDELVRGTAELVARGHDVSLLVVGGGKALDELGSLASGLGLAGRAHFPGPVPHEEVSAYYELIDIFAITRPDFPVTRLVTPLKPLEAMAMGKALILADLPALRELGRDEETALFYRPGDVDDLARQMIRLVEDPRLRGRLAANARRWVIAHRTWDQALRHLPAVYAEARRRARPRRGGSSAARRGADLPQDLASALRALERRVVRGRVETRREIAELRTQLVRVDTRIREAAAQTRKAEADSGSAAADVEGRPPERGEARTVPDEVERRTLELERDFDLFVGNLDSVRPAHLVVMFGGTTYLQDIRGNRPIRLTRVLVERGVPVLFNFHRGGTKHHIPPYRPDAEPLLFQSPTDLTPQLVKRLAGQDLGPTRRLLVVSYPHPSVCRLINVVNALGWATIYDCRDDWEEFAAVGAAKWYRGSVERYVVNNCDLTCCVSRPLQEKMRGYTASRSVRLSPNAYDPAFRTEGYRRRPSAQVRVGYFGHLTSRWFDWESLSRIAARRPDVLFEIVGHGEPDDLEPPPNVSLLGPKTHPEICDVAAQWSAAIIPFRLGKLADAVDPIKVYEYLALGLPVVSFRMPSIADYPYTTTVDTPEEFVAALDRAVVTEVDTGVTERFLVGNTWPDRVRQLLEWIDEILERADCTKSFHGEAVR